MVGLSVHYVRSKSRGRLIIVFDGIAMFEDDIKSDLVLMQKLMKAKMFKPMPFCCKDCAKKFIKDMTDKSNQGQDCFAESGVF